MINSIVVGRHLTPSCSCWCCCCCRCFFVVSCEAAAHVWTSSCYRDIYVFSMDRCVNTCPKNDIHTLGVRRECRVRVTVRCTKYIIAERNQRNNRIIVETLVGCLLFRLLPIMLSIFYSFFFFFLHVSFTNSCNLHILLSFFCMFKKRTAYFPLYVPILVDTKKKATPKPSALSALLLIRCAIKLLPVGISMCTSTSWWTFDLFMSKKNPLCNAIPMFGVFKKKFARTKKNIYRI